MTAECDKKFVVIQWQISWYKRYYELKNRIAGSEDGKQYKALQTLLNRNSCKNTLKLFWTHANMGREEWKLLLLNLIVKLLF